MYKGKRWWGTYGFATRAEYFRELHTLYPSSLEWERAEEFYIRTACEEMGVPMGYGRVPARPAQLTPPEARAQWRGDRRET